MPKGPAWTYSEKELLIKNAETMTIKELMGLLPSRSKKSIYRMIEKLREKGSVGYKEGRSRPPKKPDSPAEEKKSWGPAEAVDKETWGPVT